MVNDASASHAAYAEIVAALHAHLTMIPDVKFIRGTWLYVGLLVGIGALLVGSGLALHTFKIVALGVAWLAIGPLLAWQTRRRRYDPSQLPRQHQR